jgi:HK97 family phage portal protein
MAWPFRRKRDEQYRASSFANPDPQTLDAFGVRQSWGGERVTVDRALGLTAVFSAVEKISEAIGSLPLKVFRVLEDDERIPATNHRAWRMLHDMPNSYTTAHTFWSTVAGMLLLRGNAFLLKARDQNDIVEELHLLDPTKVQIEFNGMEKRFVMYDPAKVEYTQDQVLHILGFSLDGMIGCSRIHYCRNALSIALGRSRFEGEFYSQGARIPGVIQYPGRLGEQGVKNLAEGFKDIHTGAGNRHKVPVLEEGATWQSVGMSLEDMQFVQSAQMSRSDIANMFQLPASYLNASTGDSLRYETVEANAIQFATQAVAPLTNRIAKALSLDPSVLPWNVMYAEFVLEALFRADMKSRAEYWKVLKELEVVNAEYIASRENLPKPPKQEPVLPVSVEQPQLRAVNE